MAISSTSSIELIINGLRADIYSGSRLNLRLNNVVYDPTDVTARNGEYSFSLNLPSTPRNDRIFGYANNSSKLGKFTMMHRCQVVADGLTVFDGSLRLTDSKTDDYKCNLVSVKVNNVEDIFGEMKMDELEWEIPFTGTEDIDKVNLDGNSDVFLPLVCYGAFPKMPYASYNNGQINYYSDITTIDENNQWYWESFKPSFRLTELVRRYFGAKGYNASGNFFDDPVTREIFLSTYISDSQDPFLNLGNDLVGRLVLSGQFNNHGSQGSNAYLKGAPRTTQDLSFPRDRITLGQYKSEEYNFDRIFIYDVLSIENNGQYHRGTLGSVNEYLFRYTDASKNKGYIYIPSKGLYHIRLSITGLDHNGEASSLTYTERECILKDGDYEVQDKKVTKAVNWDNFPVEFHVIRNSNQAELIGSGDPSASYPSETQYSMYPHELDYTKYTSSKRGNREPIRVNESGRFGGARSMGAAPEELFYQTMGNTICYDPWVNPDFICGMTTINKSVSVIKNGGSWSPESTDYNQVHFNCQGYTRVTADGTRTLTEYNQNTLVDGDNYFTEDSSGRKNGVLDCVVELNAGDVLSLCMVTKCNTDVERTSSSPTGGTRTQTGDSDIMLQFNYTIVVEPYTNDVDKYVGKNYMEHRTPTEEERRQGFGIDWKLHNYLNSDEKVSDFVNNVIKTFNLSYNCEGSNVRLDFGKVGTAMNVDYIDIDDRVRTEDATFSRIDFPSYMEVKFSIDDSEAGAYRSIDTIEHQGAPNWKDYIDTGSERVVMDLTDSDNGETVDSKFSYNWWQDFNVNDNHFAQRPPSVWRIPLIAKDENFIIQSDEAVSKDGMGLKQRMWYRGYPESDKRVVLWNGKVAYAVLPKESLNGNTLDFKRHRGSMLDKYFDVTPSTESNFCEVECHISPQEYLRMKDGCLVKFDSNLFRVCEITGWDASGANKTTLKLLQITR